MFTSVNPASAQPIAQYHYHTAEEVEAALSGAADAQALWRNVALETRTKTLAKIAAILRRDLENLATLISTEMGKPISEAIGEVEKCALNCDFYAENAASFLAEEHVNGTSARYSGISYEPLGVVLAIMPWNYPLWQFFRCLAPIIAAGNGIILKHAANVPACALACERVVSEAGVPSGLMRTLFVRTGDVAALIADRRIAAVTFTGSTEVGTKIASQAGHALKKQVLELGGSDPFIVLADADIEAAARTAVAARFTNAGQSCVNAKRFIVHESAAERFLSSFVEQVASLKCGKPMDPDTQIGPLARADLRDALHSQVLRSVAAGATLRIGGTPINGPGYFYAPTILDHVHTESPAFREETFGPVAAVTRVGSTEEAIELANRTEFGLAATLWTSDLANAKSLASRIDAGAVFINAKAASDPRLPFGGIKRSGYGRELGCHGIREFTNIKTMWVG